MSKITKILCGAGLAMAASLSFNTMAADGATLYTAKLCQTCHGAEGKAPIMPLYPKLNGQNKEYLLAQMKDIKSGARNNGMASAMKAMVANVSEEEMAAIADYLSQVK
ncbi:MULTISPECIES: c-type cytochrome [Pseudoalteromonas]|jgi:cytochrome c|uniref:Cytochrome c n=1 Tax=Pseudoalteromonas lipolytica TaxID=570156 RepID=A0AAD0S1P9_9GAMM|nr:MULTISPECIES: c-type cytochrome [Pseudoalteromonas]AXV66544.1 cytochrome c [Pseudoalteromonas donghaensis]EWH04672.1 cytochrome C [Pseudoalteromonas lipolytica SCSIO 04301]MCC9661718.1 c-type cytochrome [Pseudoalteromonas sp. MB41]QLJ08068.1 c-type cytochrome [Pseudoalteromonas sp. JSTW]QMW14299.1 c-type cytochrome [Pseudoalteromonas sp. MT33b]|tara:strand:+ start:3090 stop:3413 length:324 start_codon:yes stop_codon:yes gene_type:complete